MISIDVPMSPIHYQPHYSGGSRGGGGGRGTTGAPLIFFLYIFFFISECLKIRLR